MNCESLDNLLLDLLYDEVEGDEKVEANAHLDGCEGCQKKYAGMGGVRAAFRAMPEPVMPVLSYQALLAEAAIAAKAYAAPLETPKKVEEKEGIWAKITAGMRFLLSPPVAVAAGVVLVLGVSLSINGSQKEAAVPQRAITLADEAPMVVTQAPRPQPAPASTPIVMAQPQANTGGEELWSPKEAGNATPQIETKPISTPEPTVTFIPAAKTKSAEPKGFVPVTPQAPKMAPADPSAGGMALSPVLGGSKDNADPTGYKQSLSSGNSAYRSGDLDEAEKQYEIAADKAVDGSAEQDIALAAQAQAQSAGKDCEGALASARKINEQSKGTALILAADCYAAAGNTAKAKELYTEVSSFGGSEGSEAKRSLLALETKLSKPILEDSKSTKSPAKNTNKKAPQNAAPPVNSEEQKKK